jgi:hypothetical protein
MQVIGLCRFSYPAIGGFQVEHETIEDRIAYLYADARIEERFRLMEAVALPCIPDRPRIRAVDRDRRSAAPTAP